MIDLKDEQLLAFNGPEEEAAFTELVRRHQKGLYELLRRLTLDHAAACDLGQKAWIKVFRGRAQFQGRSSFKTWLFAIALNLFRDWKRQRKADRLMPAGNSGLDSELGFLMENAQDPAPEALEVMVAAERNKKLLAAVDRLSENHRQVLNLVFQQGLTIKEAAKLLGKSPDNVKITSYRAICKLKEILGNRHD